jgi:hypothetical protein
MNPHEKASARAAESRRKLAKARVLAENIYKTPVKGTDKRLQGSVFIQHEDGSVFLWDSAYANIYDKDVVIVLTEHHGWFVYWLDDLLNLRAYGPRALIGNIKSLPTEKPKLDLHSLRDGKRLTQTAKVTDLRVFKPNVQNVQSGEDSLPPRRERRGFRS